MKAGSEETVEKTIKPEVGLHAQSNLMQNLRGIFIIARNDMMAHIKSPRMIVLTVIFILAVLGSAFLFAGLSMSQTELQPPEYLFWTYIINADDGTQPNDVLIITTNTAGAPVPDVDVTILNLNEEVLGESNTDDTGRLIFYNFTSLEILFDSSKDDYEVTMRPIIMPDGQFAQLLSELDLYVQAQAVDLDEDNVPDDVAILLLNSDLQPVSGAEVVLEKGDLDVTRTNFYGIFTDTNQLMGKHTYELTTDNNSVEVTVNVYSDDTQIENLFDLEGPDEVLITVAGFGFGLIIPVMAIGISFDSISGEKISRSIIFLLCRPISKRSIAVGKFLGSSIAIMIPLVAVSLISVGVISAITDETPSGGFVAGFIVVTIVFMTIFVMLQQIFSTLAKTTGTAILSGIAVWLFYFMFFGLIILAVSVAMGIQFLSNDYYRLANQLSLLSPSGIYSFLISQIAPSGSSSFNGIPDWSPAVAFIIWFVVLFIIAVELFRKKPYL